MDNTSNSKSLYFPLDVARFLMAFLVIAIHTTQWDNDYINRVLRLAVPFFFLSSGFFLQQKSLFEIHSGETVKLWLHKVIKMYFVWTMLYIPFSIYGFLFENDTLLNCFMGLMLGTGNYAWHLWYLVASIFGGGIIYIYKKHRINYLIVLLITFGVFFFLYYIEMAYPDHYIIYAIKRIIRGVIFLLIGIGVCTIYPFIKSKFLYSYILFFIMLLLYLYKGGNLIFIGSTSLFCMILMMCEYVKIKTIRGWFLRKMSAYIYFVHMLFVGILSIFLGMRDSIALLGLVSILSLITAYILIVPSRVRKGK